MHPIIISPPFGTYFRDHRATSIFGSYTLKKRRGRILKIAQFVFDNLRYPVEHGFRNRIELRNPGINSIEALDEKFIYSLVGLEDQDWENLYYNMVEKDYNGDITVELNLGCQNVHEYGIPLRILYKFCRSFHVIVKVPSSDRAMAIAGMCASSGVHFLHVANSVLDTIGPGSLSGAFAKTRNLPLVEQIASRYPNVQIIGGGGIYEWQDLIDYRNAGATRFSLGTVWFRPWKAREIINRFELEEMK